VSRISAAIQHRLSPENEAGLFLVDDITLLKETVTRNRSF